MAMTIDEDRMIVAGVLILILILILVLVLMTILILVRHR